MGQDRTRYGYGGMGLDGSGQDFRMGQDRMRKVWTGQRGFDWMEKYGVGQNRKGQAGMCWLGQHDTGLLLYKKSMIFAFVYLFCETLWKNVEL